MEYSKEEKIEYVSKRWKAFYGVLSQTEVKKKLDHLKGLTKNDINTLAKIKALEGLIK